MTDDWGKKINDARNALNRIQEYNPQQLVKKEDLGTYLCFEEIVEPASRIVDLYRQVPLDMLTVLPPNKLQNIIEVANADYNIFEEVNGFNADQTKAERDTLINKVINRYQPVFDALHPLISYSMHNSIDPVALEMKTRSLVQKFQDDANKTLTELEEKNKEADEYIESFKSFAVEQGVAQQAIFFKNEAECQKKQATVWLWATASVGMLLLIYAVIILFYSPYILPNPTSIAESVQLVASKLLIFFVLSYSLYFCSKNYNALKHNEVLNKHRQNALLTYKSISDAAGDQANSDIILNHAASCIYSPQSSGYSSPGKSDAMVTPVSPISMLLRRGSDGIPE